MHSLYRTIFEMDWSIPFALTEEEEVVVVVRDAPWKGT